MTGQELVFHINDRPIDLKFSFPNDKFHMFITASPTQIFRSFALLMMYRDPLRVFLYALCPLISINKILIFRINLLKRLLHVVEFILHICFIVPTLFGVTYLFYFYKRFDNISQCFSSTCCNCHRGFECFHANLE